MTLRRIAGQTPDFGSKQLNEFMKAFDRFGLLQTWTPDVYFPLVTITNKDLNGYYVRVGPVVLYFLRGTFTISVGTPPQVYVTLPKMMNDFFITGLYCIGAFYTDNNPTLPSFDFTPGFAGGSDFVVVPPDDSLTVNWSVGDKEISGFGFYWL